MTIKTDMKRRLTMAAFFVIAHGLTTIQVASAQGRPVLVDQATPAFDIGWAMVSPPRGADWYTFGDEKNAVFAKKLSPVHSFVATAFARKSDDCCANVDQLLSQIRVDQEQDRQNPRYRIVEQRADPNQWDGLSCVATRIVAEDSGSNVAPGKPLKFFQKGIACVHPDGTGEVLAVTYSERGGEAEGSPALVGEGDEFLQGLKRKRPAAQ